MYSKCCKTTLCKHFMYRWMTGNSLRIVSNPFRSMPSISQCVAALAVTIDRDLLIKHN